MSSFSGDQGMHVYIYVLLSLQMLLECRLFAVAKFSATDQQNTIYKIS